MSQDNINIKNTPASAQEDEIDLIQLAKTLWADRRIVIRTTLIFMVLGLFIAMFSAKEYAASTTMVPQSSEGGSKLGGGLGGLAAMAGINLASMEGGATMPPTLYPKIMTSVPFQKKMMGTIISVEGLDKEVTLADYYENVHKPGIFGIIKRYTIQLPRYLINSIRGSITVTGSKQNMSELLTITFKEKLLMEKLNKQLSLEVNEKDGYVKISARMPEARQAAEIVLKAQILLQEAIIDFKIKKAKDQLIFIEERYAEKQEVFIAAQEKLASFRDQNRNMRTAMAQSRMERLQSEFSIASSVFSELAKQLEAQKIQVMEDTPVFTIIEPVSIPFERSKPKRSMILIVWTFLGGVVGVGMVFGKLFFESIKEKLAS